MTLDDAITTHLDWVARFENAAKSVEREAIDPAAVGDETACEFGKWLAQNPELLGSPARHRRICDLHREFHEEAGRVANHVRQRDTSLAALADRARFDALTLSLVDALFEARAELSGKAGPAR